MILKEELHTLASREILEHARNEVPDTARDMDRRALLAN